MAFDRSSRSDSRQRRMFQKQQAGVGGFIFGDGLAYDNNTATISLGLAVTPGLEFSGGLLQINLDASPGLVIGAGGVKVLVDPAGAITLGAAGLAVAVAAASGTKIVADVLTVDLEDTTPGLQLAATGLQVLINGTTLTLAAGGLSVTAPAGKFNVTGLKIAAYNAVIDDLVRTDPAAAAGSFTVTLPTAIGASGRAIIVKQTTLSALNTVTVATTGGQTIDGAATDIVLINSLTARRYVSDGANWMII